MDAALKASLSCLKLVIFDVDGVITDGKLYLGPNGDEWRSTHVRDGLGLKNLQRAGLITAVICGRPAGGLADRLQALGVSHSYFGQDNKLPLFRDLIAQLGIAAEQAAMVGDDTPDLPLFEACGLGFCPADAHQDVRDAADWIAPSNGGQGAVREISDLILAAQ
jgi:3-deoxy-D-manno-octulosonate 8-phosphate phosphatase (KDO 8-P phosphatase)